MHTLRGWTGVVGLAPRLLAALAVAAFGATIAASPASAADTPPQNLHVVGDHWTAWSPPQSFPEGTEVYVIVPGDTLWDLAARFYQDPYLWPQLWEQNQYILDAHWIYPGDPLVLGIAVESLPPEGQVVGDLTQEDGSALVHQEDDDRFRGLLTADEAAGAPVPLGAASDIYCAGFIGEDEVGFPYQLIGSEHGAQIPDLGFDQRTRTAGFSDTTVARYNLSQSDIVYLDGATVAGLTPGEMLTVVEPQNLVTHPLDPDTTIGRFYRYRARVRVLSVQDDVAIGEVSQACGPFTVGAMLQPTENEPLPLGRKTMMRPPNLPVRAAELVGAPSIVHTVEPIVTLGSGHMVIVDQGLADDVIPGDVFTIYRENRDGLPPIVLGELAVLSVEEETALARILDARYAVYLGDRLERK